MRKLKEVLRLHSLGLSQHQIASAATHNNSVAVAAERQTKLFSQDRQRLKFEF